jgi:hypothetical protein
MHLILSFWLPICHKYLLFFFFFREKLQLEIAAREKAERKQQEYEERIKSMQDEMEKRQQDLQEAQVMILYIIYSFFRDIHKC